MNSTIAYGRWDADRDAWRHYVATFNPATGIYDLNITETDEIGIALEESA